MEEKTVEIIKNLSCESYVTSSQLADSLNLSEKTIRTRIKEIGYQLRKDIAFVESKRHYGYKLVIIDQNKFDDFLDCCVNKTLNNTEERKKQLTNELLCNVGYTKLDDICEKYYISRNTASKTIRDIEQIFAMYDLKIDRRPNYGLKVNGSEFNKRTFIVNNIYDYYCDYDREDFLMQLLLKINEVSGVKMSELLMNNFVKYVVVMNKRFNSFPIENIEIEQSEATKKIIDDYCTELEKSIGKKFDNNEKSFLIIHYSSCLSSDSYSKYGPNFVITGKIDELVYKMLTRIYDTFNINFKKNLELRMTLNQHMVPADIRLRYRIPVDNPLLDMIKQKYSFPYALAVTAATCLEEYYNRGIPEEEIAYLAIILALATEKNYTKVAKKNVVLVCITGKNSAQLFKYKYRQAFGEYIDTIYECCAKDLDLIDFNDKKIDYIFTTVPLSKKYDVPVCEINLFFETNDILTYSEMFKNSGNSTVLNYYSPRLFISNLKAETREEVIYKMCQKIDECGLLPEGFYDAVIKREHMGQTDFGNLVAWPHPCKSLSNQSFATVAVLDKPIMWKNNMVQVVFLLSIGSTYDSELEVFHEKTSELFFDQMGIQRLINNPSFDTLSDILTGK